LLHPKIRLLSMFSPRSLPSGILAGLTLLALGGCDNPSEPVEPAGPASIVLSPENPTVLLADTLHLTASVTDPTGAPMSDVRLTWSSSDPSTATVDSLGVVWTLKAGTTTVSVAAGEVSDSTQVTIREPDPAAWREIVTPNGQICGILEDDRLYCWRVHSAGLVEGYLLAGKSFTELSTMGSEACGLTTTGEVHCWMIITPEGPHLVPEGHRFERIAGGLRSGCGITAEGPTLCWISRPQSIDVLTWTGPLALENDPGLVSISSNGEHACGLTAEGAAYCWGKNEVGQLGDGTTTTRAGAAPVSTELRFVEITAGRTHTCGRTAEGELHCWGHNTQYQLGIAREGREGCAVDDGFWHCALPQTVATDLRFSEVRAGVVHTCALTTEGKPHCWGANVAGILGVPHSAVTYDSCRIGATYPCTPVPTAVSGGHTFTSLSQVGSAHHCGLTAERTAYCWGDVSASGIPPGNLLTGTTPPVRLPEPRRVPNTVTQP
jgi:hypothetical protein